MNYVRRKKQSEKEKVTPGKRPRPSCHRAELLLSSKVLVNENARPARRSRGSFTPRAMGRSELQRAVETIRPAALNYGGGPCQCGLPYLSLIHLTLAVFAVLSGGWQASVRV